MLNDYDAVVVGGGIAGLTSAAYLCRQGVQTLLCEKAENTGGLVQTFRHRGYAFDAGIRAFENSGILFPMLNSLGLDIPFVKNDVSIGIGERWVRLHSRDSLHDYFDMLSALFPENRQDIGLIETQVARVIQYMDVLYGIDNPIFMGKPDKEYLTKTLLPWLVKYQVNIRKASRLNAPVRAYLQGLTNNEKLIDMLVQHFFMETPTFFALSYFGQYFDYRYPMGGTGTLAAALTRYIKENGGTVATGTAVAVIDEQRKEIVTEQGARIAYKKAVWAADQKLLYKALRTSGNRGAVRQQARLDNSRGCDSVLTIFMGVALEAKLFGSLFGPHAFYTPSPDGISALSDWQAAAAEGEDGLYEWVSAYLKRTTYEISCPALCDPSLAPEGGTGLMISTLMDVAIVRRFSEAGAYESFKRFCTEKISEILEPLIPGLAERTEFKLCATPLTLEHETGNTDGAITGWAFTNKPIPAENRFQKITRAIRTPLKDIYQCGQWTFSPSGLPISILTGKLAADAVVKTLK